MLTWRGYKSTEDNSLLTAIERNNQIILPVEYKDTVMRFNKGVPSKKLIQCDGKERIFSRLITITPDVHPNVIDAVKWVEESNRVIPFGLDPFGNLFAFKYGGSEDYEIVFIDGEMGTTHLICSSFSDFLYGLYE